MRLHHQRRRYERSHQQHQIGGIENSKLPAAAASEALNCGCDKHGVERHERQPVARHRTGKHIRRHDKRDNRKHTPSPQRFPARRGNHSVDKEEEYASHNIPGESELAVGLGIAKIPILREIKRERHQELDTASNGKHQHTQP